jgi:hypothetical protein
VPVAVLPTAKSLSAFSLEPQSDSLLGYSVAVSADGNTAIVGGVLDNSGAGAAWVFTRSGGAWSQQGAKLVGSGAVGAANQGYFVAISSDGNTAIVGGPADDSNTGAAWVYTRSGGVWGQQGAKLVGSGAVLAAQQGYSIALSGDGNTATVGGPADNGSAGTAWVFTRSGGVWSQQGAKLVGSNAVGAAVQGRAVALSADGDTAMVGGYNDNGSIGAVWVYTRSGGVWTQQGNKLVGTGAVGAAGQGISAALSSDGNIAIVGGNFDNSSVGAMWVYTRSGGVWSQQGSKLAGTDAVGPAHQATSVALSADGYTAIAGGFIDNSGAGAAWVFVQPVRLTATHDFNGDGKSDILWRNSDGTVGMWLMNGTQFTPSSFGVLPLSWTIVGTGDFNGDGKGDILWRNADGTVGLWLMNGTQILSTSSFGILPTSWTIAGTGDFNGDGKWDILWRNADGAVGLWLMNGTQILSTTSFGILPTSWTIVGTGDFNGDGKTDILWRNADGTVGLWLMNGTQIVSTTSFGVLPASWSIFETGDFNGDGKSDILWREAGGTVGLWFMNGTQILSTSSFGVLPTSWTIQGANAD